MFYAHSKPGLARQHWESLAGHHQAVENRASRFAGIFGAARLAALAGRWHDLGKASAAFQERVLGLGLDEAKADLLGDSDIGQSKAKGGVVGTIRERVDHSTAGARYAIEVLGDFGFGRLVGYVIAGHHGRLANWDGDGGGGALRDRLDPAIRAIEPFERPADPGLPADLRELIPISFQLKPDVAALQQAMLTRMVFSTLIDADRLETERFFDRRTSARRPKRVHVTDLRRDLDNYIEGMLAAKTGRLSPVDTSRSLVLSACRKRAEDPPGLFSLTVPTGGGKTLASLAFALRHAEVNGLRGIIFALPFTSIIEQTASVFRKVFDDTDGCVVLEHHSNLDPARQSLKSQLAAENWDASVIVTTNVQLFESLFSAYGSTCRKLHNLAGSVIVLDEAQVIPPHLLKPVLATIGELARNYRCSIVLCSATQPAIHHRPSFPIGLQKVTEIVSDPLSLYRAMRRVEVEPLGPVEDAVLVDRLMKYGQVLCIVNTREHAAAVCDLLAERGVEVLHLSAAMCPEHRSQQIALIREALYEGRPCRVVSTPVIEAGVDVDFPVLYRVLAGFDSIAQAAGRCNREGRLGRAKVYVFETNHQLAVSMRSQVAAARQLLQDHPDPLTLDAIERYFELVYWKRKRDGLKPWDAKDVMGCFGSDMVHRFRDAERDFKWIDQQTTSVVVPFGVVGCEIVEHLLRDDEPDWRLLRRAQRYSVSVYDNQLAMLIENTTVAPCFPDADGTARFWMLTNPAAYDEQFGLRMEVEGWDAIGLIG